jgi:uncharacterized protein YhfF
MSSKGGAMSRTIEQFWQECCRAIPGAAAAGRYKLRTFGASEEMARRLLDLIASGEKTGTFAVDWEYDGKPGERPMPGDYYVVTGFSGEPELLIRVTHTEVVPFIGIDQRHVQCEGRTLRQVEPWRKVHWDYWTKTLEKIGRKPAEDMPVLYQEFEVVYPATGRLAR